MNSINLLPSNKKVQLKGQKNLQLIRKVALYGLGGIGLISLVLFALNIDTATPALKQQESATAAQLNLLQNRTAKLLHIKDRLSAIDKILKQRGSVDTLIAQIELMVPQDVSIDDLQIEKGTITFTVSSSSLLSLSNFLDSLSDAATNKQLFSAIKITDLVADGSAGKYNVSVKAQLL